MAVSIGMSPWSNSAYKGMPPHEEQVEDQNGDMGPHQPAVKRDLADAAYSLASEAETRPLTGWRIIS